MHRRPRTLPPFLSAALLVLAAARAEAASLQRVNDWGASGVPSTASMYIYVPDQVAAKPPILVVAHYCSGTASAVFGQAQSGGIVRAADMYGFIIVVPQTSNNCWDVGSTKALTHDGGGDTQAIAQMVKYALTTHNGNADRVYITGDSSGAMMTEGMLAVYPDVFKGGSEFAGVPAGCWAVGNPDGSWSSQCAGGMVTHTATEWGDLARAMYQNYSGHRPRVQLFHGDADSTIRFANHTEAIKQWTNVLGLPATPTMTDTVTLGNHQAKRERWQNSCGYVVLDAFTSMGGDHGPSDALFNSSFVIPFLELDDTAEVDPEITMCGSSGGAGGMGGTGGVAGGGAGAGAGTGGASGTMGLGGAGDGGVGGITTSGGAGAAAGSIGVSGTSGTGMGGQSIGGAGTATGGTLGTSGTGGTSGGTGTTAGTTSTGGTATTGGTGMGGTATGATAGTTTSGTGGNEGTEEPGGCGCGIPGRHSRHGTSAAIGIGLALLTLRKRRRAR